MKFLFSLSLFAGWPHPPQQQARVESFSPQGTVKRIRQVLVRFSEPMVPFGDPRAINQPFDITCSEKGTPRWVDDRNWVFDFDRDLPAGVRCEFRVKEGLHSLKSRPDLTLTTDRLSPPFAAELLSSPQPPWPSTFAPRASTSRSSSPEVWASRSII
jgi:hypothetical protein